MPSQRIAVGRTPHLLGETLVQAIAKHADLELIDYKPDATGIVCRSNVADVYVVSATDIDADGVACEIFRSAPNCGVIVVTPDGRAASVFSTETARKSLPDPSVDDIVEAIRTLSGKRPRL